MTEFVYMHRVGCVQFGGRSLLRVSLDWFLRAFSSCQHSRRQDRCAFSLVATVPAVQRVYCDKKRLKS